MSQNSHHLHQVCVGVGSSLIEENWTERGDAEILNSSRVNKFVLELGLLCACLSYLNSPSQDRRRVESWGH